MDPHRLGSASGGLVWSHRLGRRASELFSSSPLRRRLLNVKGSLAPGVNDLLFFVRTSPNRWWGPPRIKGEASRPAHKLVRDGPQHARPPTSRYVSPHGLTCGAESGKERGGNSQRSQWRTVGRSHVESEEHHACTCQTQDHEATQQIYCASDSLLLGTK